MPPHIFWFLCTQSGSRHGPWNCLISLHWRHNDHGGVSNRQPRGCLCNRLSRQKWKTSKLRVTGLCAGNSSRPVNSPHKGPITRFAPYYIHLTCPILYTRSKDPFTNIDKPLHEGTQSSVKRGINLLIHIQIWMDTQYFMMEIITCLINSCISFLPSCFTWL